MKGRNSEVIRWLSMGNEGMVEKGEMPLSRVPESLNEFHKAAVDVMEKTGADHVLYGMKMYRSDFSLAAMHFYLMPMSEKEFREKVGRAHNSMIYAVHNSRR